MTRITLSDGRMGQELIRHGDGVATALWATKVQLDAPNLVGAVHCDYASAGARVASTNTYALHADRLRSGAPQAAGRAIAAQANAVLVNCAVPGPVAAALEVLATIAPPLAPMPTAVPVSHAPISRVTPPPPRPCRRPPICPSRPLPPAPRLGHAQAPRSSAAATRGPAPIQAAAHHLTSKGYILT